ncbi:MAG: hypothetical protein ACRD2A_15590, partial [Vicinamibacterales bacterium]
MSVSVKVISRLLAITAAALLVVACESTFDVSSYDQTWGFIQTGALAAAGGTYATSPTGQFFRGNLMSIPDARVKPDTCSEPLQILQQGPLQVTFLDAGSAITTQFGTRVDTIPRVSASSRTTYESSTPKSFRPGDSLIVRIPGALGGFPTAEIRAKTAEAFTFDTLVIRPSPAPLQLRWTPATDNNSAMLAEFRYSSIGSTTPNFVIRCAFVDDGADSVAFPKIQTWVGQNANARTVTYT